MSVHFRHFYDERKPAVSSGEVHCHSHTCRKNTKSDCRFNYPQPPMRQTTILYPLDDDMQQSQIKMHKDQWKSIKMHLDEMKEGEEISFDELLLYPSKLPRKTIY